MREVSLRESGYRSYSSAGVYSRLDDHEVPAITFDTVNGQYFVTTHALGGPVFAQIFDAAGNLFDHDDDMATDTALDFVNLDPNGETT